MLGGRDIIHVSIYSVLDILFRVRRLNDITIAKVLFEFGSDSIIGSIYIRLNYIDPLKKNHFNCLTGRPRFFLKAPNYFNELWVLYLRVLVQFQRNGLVPILVVFSWKNHFGKINEICISRIVVKVKNKTKKKKQKQKIRRRRNFHATSTR